MSQIHTGLHMQDSTYRPKGTPAVAPADVADNDNKSGAAATATPNVALEGQAQPPPEVDPASMSAQQSDINDTEVSQVGSPRSWAYLHLATLLILKAHLDIPQGLPPAIRCVAAGSEASSRHAMPSSMLTHAEHCLAVNHVGAPQCETA